MWAAWSGGRWRWKASKSQGYSELAEHLSKISNHFQQRRCGCSQDPLWRRSLTSPVVQPGGVGGWTKAAFAIPPGPFRASGQGPCSSPELSCASLISQAGWEEGRCSAMLRDLLRPCMLLRTCLLHWPWRPQRHKREFLLIIKHLSFLLLAKETNFVCAQARGICPLGNIQYRLWALVLMKRSQSWCPSQLAGWHRWVMEAPQPPSSLEMLAAETW